MILQIFLISTVNSRESRSFHREQFRVGAKVVDHQIQTRFHTLDDFIGCVLKLQHSWYLWGGGTSILLFFKIQLFIFF